MKIFKKFFFSFCAMLLIGFAYYFLLRNIYFNPMTNSFNESSLNDNFIDVLQGLVNIDFNGKSVSIFSLTATTLLHFIVSFLGAVVLGISVGIIIGTYYKIGKISDYFINFFRVLPSIVFIIIFKYQLKLFDYHVYFVGILASIWPVIINTKSGVISVNRTMRDSIKILNIPRFKKLTLFTLPEASPNICMA